MGHVELRPLHDDDLDAVFEMMRDHEGVALASFTASDPDDRDAFDAWISGERHADGVDLAVITEDGAFAGTAAAFVVGDDREVSFWVERSVWGRGVATEALRLLVSREPIRPLFGRVAGHNQAAIAVFAHNGFTEISRSAVFAPGLAREVDEVVVALLPTLDGV